MDRPTTSDHRILSTRDPFSVKLSDARRRTLEALFGRFQQLMIDIGLQDQWALAFGTLLGSLRHHDVIPWDDDGDVFLPDRHRAAVQAALDTLPPPFLVRRMRASDKLFMRLLNGSLASTDGELGSVATKGVPWGWPFLDIFYLHDVAPGVLATDEDVEFAEADLFPTTYRPLGPNWYPAPRRPLKLTTLFYREAWEVCTTHFWSHFIERGVKSVRRPCSQLLGISPFVQRSRPGH